MITQTTTLLELERIMREYHVQSISAERPPNDRSGVATRLERRDGVVVVRTGSTLADALNLALAHLISLPYTRTGPPCSCGVDTWHESSRGRCMKCGGTVPQ